VGSPGVHAGEDVTTAHLLDDVPTEIVSDRMNVSQQILSRHYDRMTAREKMEQRRRDLRD
jgi:hypothetical protein